MQRAAARAACRRCPARSGDSPVTEAERHQVRGMREHEAQGRRFFHRRIGPGHGAKWSNARGSGCECAARSRRERYQPCTLRRSDADSRQRPGRACRAIAAMSASRRPRRREAKLVVVAAGQQALRARCARSAPRELSLSAAERGSASRSIVAPILDASSTWPRSPIRPSDTSIAAVAMPRSARPSVTRGAGRSQRVLASCKLRAAASRDRCPAGARIASAASPSCPETQIESPPARSAATQRLSRPALHRAP